MRGTRLAAAVFALWLATPASALAQEPQFQAGDRVEVDIRGSLQAAPDWVEAQIVEVMRWNGAISGIHVRLDDGRQMTVAARDLRRAAGARPPAQPGGQQGTVSASRPQVDPGRPATAWRPIVDANNTVLADRPLIDCNFQQPRTTPNARPPVELLKRLIRCMNERPALMPGSDGAVTMDITRFVVGAPRRWVAGSGFGDGNANTTVWSIEVGYTKTIFYRSGNTIQDIVWIYGCWVNNVRQWECGTNRRVREGPVRNVP